MKISLISLEYRQARILLLLISLFGLRTSAFSKTIEIEIFLSSKSDSLIVLPDYEELKVDRNDKVVWFTNVANLTFSIKEVENEGRVFRTPPSSERSRRVEGNVRWFSPWFSEKVFVYKIEGSLNTGGNVTPIDPKIAIYPSFPFTAIVLSGGIALCFLGFRRFKKWFLF